MINLSTLSFHGLEIYLITAVYLDELSAGPEKLYALAVDIPKNKHLIRCEMMSCILSMLTFPPQSLNRPRFILCEQKYFRIKKTASL